MNGIENLRRLANIAREKANAHKKMLDDNKNRPITPGDVYLLQSGDCGSRWMVATTNPRQNNLFFVVPIDGHPLFGIADVFTGENINIRCGLGYWIKGENFPADKRIDIADVTLVRIVQKKLYEVLTGTCDGPEAARESEANPEYHEWMNEVAKVARKLWR